MTKDYEDSAKSAQDPYAYPGTTTLKNKFDIRDRKILLTLERRITETKTLALSRTDSEILKGSFNLEHLCAIHRYLFGDIYDWAGELRKNDFIGASKSAFCSAALLETYANSIFSKMRLEPFSQMNQRECAQKMAYYLLQVNALHPFRVGNERAILMFFEAIAFKHGWQLSLFKIPNKLLQKAMIQGMSESLASLSQLLRFYISRIDDYE